MAAYGPGVGSARRARWNVVTSTYYDTLNHSVIPMLKEAFKIIEDMNISQDEWKEWDPQDRHHFNMLLHGIQTATENAEEFCRGEKP
jgi:hypothetical protein